jgi:hypothetical protein
MVTFLQARPHPFLTFSLSTCSEMDCFGNSVDFKVALFFSLCSLISHAPTGALLSAIVDGTEKADLVGTSLDGPTGSMQPPDPLFWSTSIEELGRYFDILLLFPSEAFKGGNAATLARRAVLTDQATSHSSDPLSFSTLVTRTSCRLFASRCLQDLNSSFADYVSLNLAATDN